MSVLSRWKDRLRTRRQLEAAAKSEHERAQAALEKARAKDLHPRERLVYARDQAATKLKLRRRQVAEAERVVARHTAAGVVRPKPERTKLSPCRWSPRNSPPRRIVVHITVSHNRPGLADLDAILNFFAQPSTKASSHIVNDSEGHDARCVLDSDAAWTQAAYNPDSLSIEQIEYADKPRERWLTENLAQLNNTALWIAVWSVAHGIPIVHSTESGVCEHRELGAAGGGHSDVGPGYPLDVVLAKARDYARDLRRTA